MYRVWLCIIVPSVMFTIRDIDFLAWVSYRTTIFSISFLYETRTFLLKLHMDFRSRTYHKYFQVLYIILSWQWTTGKVVCSVLLIPFFFQAFWYPHLIPRGPPAISKTVAPWTWNFVGYYRHLWTFYKSCSHGVYYQIRNLKDNIMQLF